MSVAKNVYMYQCSNEIVNLNAALPKQTQTEKKKTYQKEMKKYQNIYSSLIYPVLCLLAFSIYLFSALSAVYVCDL